MQQLLETLAILGEVDRVGRGAENRDIGRFQRLGEVERRLPAKLHDNAQDRAAPLFDAHDLHHVLGGQRFEIEPVRGVVIGRDGFRIAVDHDRLDAGFPQRVGGMDAAIIELDALADPVWSAAEDDDLAPGAWLRLAFGRVDPVALVGRVKIRGQRGEFGGAGVDALVDRRETKAAARFRDLAFVEPRKAREAPVGKSHLLEPQECCRVLRKPVAAHALFGFHDFPNAVEEPRFEVASGMDLGGGETVAVGLRDQQ